jgi:hypothetical protein
VPQPTAEALAQNKNELESRSDTGMMGQFLSNFRRRPDMTAAAHVGDPTLVDPQIVSATEVTRDTMRAFSQTAPTGPSTVGIEAVKGAFGPNQPAPRSDAPPSDAPAADPSAAPNAAPSATPTNKSGVAADAPAYGELKPEAAAADAQPAAEVPPPAPAQTNEIQPAGATDNKPPDSVNQPPAVSANDAASSSSSSSSSKKKKGKKVIPF